MLEPDGSRLRTVPPTMISGPPAFNVTDPITTCTRVVIVLLVEELKVGGSGVEVNTAPLFVMEYPVSAMVMGGSPGERVCVSTIKTEGEFAVMIEVPRATISAVGSLFVGGGGGSFDGGSCGEGSLLGGGCCEGGSFGTLGGSVGFAPPGFGTAPGAGSPAFGEGSAGSLTVGVEKGLSPFPVVKVYGGSKKADIPCTQAGHKGLREKSWLGTDTAGEQRLYVYGIAVPLVNVGIVFSTPLIAPLYQVLVIFSQFDLVANVLALISSRNREFTYWSPKCACVNASGVLTVKG